MKGKPFPTVFAQVQVPVSTAAPPYLWRELAQWKVTMQRDGTCYVGSLFQERTSALRALEQVVDGFRVLENPAGRQVNMLERDFQRLLRAYQAWYGAIGHHTGNATLASSYQVTRCRRCGGGGRHSFHRVHADRCFGCGGIGRMVVDGKKQRPLKATAALATARAGDIITIDFVLYLVEEIRWIAYQVRESGSVNQAATCRRMIDGQTIQQERLGTAVDPSQAILLNGKEVYGCVFVPVDPTEEMIGQVVPFPMPLLA